MTDITETASAGSHVDAVMVEAFGVPFAVLDDIPLVGLSRADPSSPALATTVREDPDAVSDRWREAQPERTREIRRGDRVLVSVAYDPDRGYLVHADDLGTGLVSPDGLEIVWAPDLAASRGSELLTAQVMPLAATVRGFEVFHAAAVVLDGHAHMLCGAAGVGKTSLAAHLVIGGADLLSDDVTALDARFMAYPGTAVLRMREPEAERIDGAPTPRLSDRQEIPGRVRFAATAVGKPHPLRALHLLERADTGASIERLDQPRPTELLGATFNLSVQTEERLVRQLDLCARMAAEVPIFRVRIRPDQDAAGLAAELAENARNGLMDPRP